MKKPPSIDTLRYAQNLQDAGVDQGVANGMAQALNEELTDRLLTKADLEQALAPVHVKLAEIDQRFDAVDAKFDAKIGALDAKVDAKINALDAKINALDAKIDARVDALDTKIDARVDALDTKIDALDAKFEGKFNSLSTKLVFGFSMVFLVLSSLVALGVIQVVRATPPAAPATAVVESASDPTPIRLDAS